MKANVLRLAAIAAGLVPALVLAQANAPRQCSAGLSRSAVLADIEIYRSSGLAALDRSEFNFKNPSPQRSAAEARYQQARSSPDFEQRAVAIAQRRGERTDGLCALPASS
jgi:hypothetical protein